MKTKVIIGGIVIAVGLVFGAVTFFESNVEYTDFASARRTHKKVQVKGEWLREKENTFDAGHGEFSFYMRDDNGEEVHVLYRGARPNNFELATSIVVKGKYQEADFHATEILTKCPSKYEANTEPVGKTL
jgi:cytochrome c-type biogenesis protein CcmE